MWEFDYQGLAQELLTPEIVHGLSAIHEYKGRQSLWIETAAQELSIMRETAKFQSLEAVSREASCHLEKERLLEITRHLAVPQVRSEAFLSGYRDVLSGIHDSYQYTGCLETTLMQIRRDLFRYVGEISGAGLRGPGAGQKIPAVSAEELPDVFERMCLEAQRFLNQEKAEPLLLMPAFFLDLLCVRPFSSGNGHVAALMFLLLLYRSNYMVGKYVSIGSIVQKNEEMFYQLLQCSCADWKLGHCNYRHITQFFLDVILEAFREISLKAEAGPLENLTASQRVTRTVRGRVGCITKAEITALYPDITKGTVERALAELVQRNVLLKVSGGRYTAYVYNRTA